MRNFTIVFSSLSAAALLLLGAPLSAQDIQNAPPEGTIMVEQTSDLEAVGKWTMLLPTQESFERTDAKLDVPHMLPGKYTFLTVPPKGTVAHIDLYLGDDIIAKSDTPQLSFTLADKMTLQIKVHYSLTIFGKVGVNSSPAGVPFTLRGPNAFVRSGVTPAEFSPSPIGNYSVTFSPGGCPVPPVQAGLLQMDSRVDFSLNVICSTFTPVISDDGAQHVSTTYGGQTVTFTDVPMVAWFAPYISTVTGRGVMGGYVDAQGRSSGLFGPGDPVTIAQLAKIAHTALDLDENEFMTAPQNPLSRGQWFTRFIASAEERGWLVYSDGTADPNRPATRGEVVTTLLQIFDIPVRWARGSAFTDVLRKTPYSGAIETAAEEGIVSGATGADGRPTGMFHPLDPITRAEIAKILITVYEKYQADQNDE